MSETAPGKAQNLNEGSAQALQALLNSIAPGAVGSVQNGSKVTPELAAKLSNKLTELLGDDIIGGSNQQRNENGELVNEEGLPIIDINEPTLATIQQGPTLHADNAGLIPLFSLHDAERDRLRRERDRVLDLLEEEERQEEERNKDLESDQKRETLQHRKEGVKDELERLKAAKEMQKRMGKALLRNMAEAREREEQAQKELLAEAEQSQEERRTLRPKKSVSFAGLPDNDSEGELPQNQIDFEEDVPAFLPDHVVPAKLRARTRPTLMTKAQMEKHPMKMDIVERVPRTLMGSEKKVVDEGDSDDESVPPDSPVAADSDNGDIICSDQENEEPLHEDRSSDEAVGELALEEEYDINFARHQRQIALEYYEKRTTIGQESLKAMSSHSHDEVEGEDDWNQAEVPLEATLSSPHPKPLISRFKSDRFSSHPGTSSTSTTATSKSLPSVLPASHSRTLQRAIRTGKLESGNLVGGPPGESGSEDEDGTMREILELLSRGDVHNIGPEDNTHAPTSSEAAFSRQPPVLNPKQKPKTSKFKLARSPGQRHPSPQTPSPPSRSSTPIFTVGRSSPKLPTRTEVIERQPPAVVQRTLSKPLSQPVPVAKVIESPSFPVPPVTSPGFPTIIDSPSFPQKVSNPTIIASPSFPSSQSTRSSSSRPDRPPLVMSSAVRESTRSSGHAEVEEEGDDKPRRVSRFLSERMQGSD